MKKEYIYIIGAAIVAALIFFKRKPIEKAISNMTRGYRNNNFGNIRLTFDKNGKKTFWTGEIEGTDTAFKTFKTAGYGYRAIFVLLDSYLKKGRNTIEKIISVYAPSNENNTLNYINTVSKLTNLQPDEAVTINDFPKIVAAISKVENGKQPVQEHINEGLKLYKNV